MRGDRARDMTHTLDVQGQIFECEIEPSEAGFFAGKEEKYVRPVCSVWIACAEVWCCFAYVARIGQVRTLGPNQSVCGLRFEQFPASHGCVGCTWCSVGSDSPDPIVTKRLILPMCFT